MKFYQVPRFIFNPIASEGICEGSCLLPTDWEGNLEKEIRVYGKDDITSNKIEANVTDPDWWYTNKGQVDWVIAITQGSEYTEWILDYGLDTANKGICILDRITFLEPTRKREGFLDNSCLTNLKILSPRPAFRADGNQSKDSVTSAWFVFRKAGAARVNTKVDFEVGWDRPKRT